jgi:hypothetical protein
MASATAGLAGARIAWRAKAAKHMHNYLQVLVNIAAIA